MPNRLHYKAVARELKLAARLKGSFDTVRRYDITTKLREISGEPSTRIKARVASDLERALLDEGMRCYPSLNATEAADYILVFNAGGVLGSIVDLVAYPSPDTARDLGVVLRKVKGLPAPEKDSVSDGNAAPDDAA